MVSEVAHCLRDAIQHREFLHQLPGVRKISHDLQVSIPTVLGALRVLESEGLVRSQPGKRAQIISSKRPPSKREVKPRRIVFLTFARNWIAGSDYYANVLHDLRKLGIHILHLECLSTSKALLQKRLQELTAAEKPDCWVLLGPPEEAQAFFARARLPCIIDGVAVEGLPLPDFEVDFVALYRHAVNHLQRQGHRRICLVTTKHSAGINPASIEVFRDCVKKSLPPGEAWEPIRLYDGTTTDFTRLLRVLFPDAASAPTALVVAHTKRVAGVMTWLMREGFRIPRDVSLISRDYDDTLESLYPLPAHYRQPPSAAKRFTRAILTLLDKRHIRTHYRVMTEFVEGRTVASAGTGRTHDCATR